jgi:hypothetical protein
MGRNPATGEAIKIKASKKVAFRAANRQIERSYKCFARPWGRHWRLQEIKIGRFGASGRALL